MCVFKAPSMSMPTPVQPPQRQEAKPPEQTGSARKRMAGSAGMAGSTLLTGPSGVESSQVALGKSTLLGQ